MDFDSLRRHPGAGELSLYLVRNNGVLVGEEGEGRRGGLSGRGRRGGADRGGEGAREGGAPEESSKGREASEGEAGPLH